MVKPVLVLPLLWRCLAKSHKCNIPLYHIHIIISISHCISSVLQFRIRPHGNPILNHPPSLHYHASVLQLHCWTWPCILRDRSVIFQIQAACWYSADTQLAASSSWRQRVKVSKDTPVPDCCYFLCLLKSHSPTGKVLSHKLCKLGYMIADENCLWVWQRKTSGCVSQCWRV